MMRDTLLIIDDSELDLAILNEIFKGIFRVECCQEANQALSFIHKNAERICAALVDICLGRRGAGFTLLHRLQTNALTTQLPIILITSDASKDNVMNGVEYGAVDFLVKPIDPILCRRGYAALCVPLGRKKQQFWISVVQPR